MKSSLPLIECFIYVIVDADPYVILSYLWYILLLQAYGAEAGVAALKWLPYGGRGVQPSEKLTQIRKWESALVR